MFNQFWCFRRQLRRETFILTSWISSLFYPEVVKTGALLCLCKHNSSQIFTFWTHHVGICLAEINPGIFNMSDRKRSREHREDRHERKKHRESELEDDKFKNQTRKLVYEVQKIKHVETLWVPQKTCVINWTCFMIVTYCNHALSEF